MPVRASGGSESEEEMGRMDRWGEGLCMCRQEKIERERTEGDADIKVDARRMKTEGKMEQKRAEKTLWAMVTQQQCVINCFGDVIYEKQNIYRSWLFTDKCASRNKKTNNSTQTPQCPKMHKAKQNLPQKLH